MTNRIIRALCVLLAGAAATSAFAGGPIFTYDTANRVPYAWNMASWPGGAVPVYTDLGNLKNSAPLISNARANELTAAGFGQWNDVASSSFNAAIVGDVSVLGFGDINLTNVAQVVGVFNGGGIHVIYDTDGAILTNFFGVSPTSVLGISNVEWSVPDSPEIVESWSVMSGPAVRSADPNAVGFSGVFTHEFGHALNLGHSQANGATAQFSTEQPQARDCAAPWTGKPGVTQVETMYPFINPTLTGTGPNMATVDRLDDIAALSNLYPAPGWPENFGTIRGTVSARWRAQGGAQNNAYEVTGVNVIARNAADPFNDFTSYLSGQVSKGAEGPDGSFELNGLTPGASYVVYLDNVIQGAFSVPRLIVLPGPEEYYNGAGESADGATDNRCAWTAVTATAGTPATADIAFNRVKGMPEFIPMPSNGLPTDITADGGIVVGALGGNAFRWDVAAGTVENLGGETSIGGQPAISDDGTKIAANNRMPSGVSAPAIYENGVWTNLPLRPDAVAPCGTGTNATWGSTYDISGDGSTVVGLSYANGCSQSVVDNIRGFKATSAGTVVLPKVDSPNRAGRANAVNYDGSLIVGWNDSVVIGGRNGCYWIDGVAYPILNAGQPVGEVVDTTRDGLYTAGLSSNPGTARNAWRATQSGGVEILGSLTGGRSSGAGALSDDGSVIGGWTDTVFTRIPAIWTQELGWSNFNTFMNAQGLYVQDVSILNSTAMSADGRTITGFATSVFGQIGWVLQSPKAVICHAPPNNPTNTHSIDVSFPGGLANHLAHGDTLGLCQNGGL
jgi:uncharacterized membrane protein